MENPPQSVPSEARGAISAKSTEAELDSAELRKKQLEIAVLERSLTMRSSLLEWLKALGTSAAFLALFWTIWSGLKQIDQSREAAIDERLAKAVEYLNSNDKDQRQKLLGVLEVSTFLIGNDPVRKSAALSFLIDALANEPDSAVRERIINSVARLNTKPEDKGMLTNALEAVLQSNRRILSAANLPRISLATADYRSTEYTVWLPRRNDGSKHGMIGVSQPVDPPNKALLDRLSATARVAVILLSKGASAKNFDGIYCSDCDFSSAKIDLSHSDFSRSILHNANFSGLKLANSTFEDAYLLGARFNGAVLTGTTFTTSHGEDDFRDTLALTGQLPLLPNFGEADLTMAVFGSHTLLAIVPGAPFLDQRGLVVAKAPEILSVFDSKTVTTKIDFGSAKFVCVAPAVTETGVSQSATGVAFLKQACGSGGFRSGDFLWTVPARVSSDAAAKIHRVIPSEAFNWAMNVAKTNADDENAAERFLSQ